MLESICVILLTFHFTDHKYESDCMWVMIANENENEQKKNKKNEKKIGVRIRASWWEMRNEYNPHGKLP